MGEVAFSPVVVRFEDGAARGLIRLGKTSITNALNTIPGHVDA